MISRSRHIQCLTHYGWRRGRLGKLPYSHDVETSMLGQALVSNCGMWIRIGSNNHCRATAEQCATLAEGLADRTTHGLGGRNGTQMVLRAYCNRNFRCWQPLLADAHQGSLSSGVSSAVSTSRSSNERLPTPGERGSMLCGAKCLHPNDLCGIVR